ncbi:hypothetical protein KIW84_053576 [Lathyrus oleraceus]|uniref:Uncharacterized protein n=1 Tax=Pisum sativum TaxID=3888 RepID=A0A9D4WTI6_PEA|nr:hypothetical protein KIW84_053576 [Pisum sativum]
MYTSCLDLLLHLIGRRNNVDGPWMLIGDFNNIIHLSEQKGGNFNDYRAIALWNVIDKCNLVEVDLIGGKFTWNGPCTQNRMIYHNLDKALVDLVLHMAFIDAYVEVLCKFHSDHNPIQVIREEVTYALNQMHPFKAPGPDGFQEFLSQTIIREVNEGRWKLVSTNDQANNFVDKLNIELNNAKEALAQVHEPLNTIAEERDESKHYEVKLKETLEKAKEDAKEVAEKLVYIENNLKHCEKYFKTTFLSLKKLEKELL